MFFPFCVFIHTIDAPQLLHFTTRILRLLGFALCKPRKPYRDHNAKIASVAT
jgi:hypothetical protein